MDSERMFREYVAAVADDEIEAAELYANYSADEGFVELVTAWHKVLDLIKANQS